MSSWKNASKANQRTHRERHQPKHRQELGLLEKKKDYKLRAEDYHEKQSTITKLRKRALARNPDEFYFHMINSRVMSGEHHDLPKTMKDEDTEQQEKLINSQSFNYIAMKRTAESKKVAKLQAELHLLDVANQTSNRHTFFVDSVRDLKHFDLSKRLDTHPDLLGRRINRPRAEMLKKVSFPVLDDDNSLQAAKEKVKRYKELSKRVEREHEMSVVEQKYYIKRQLLKKEQKPVKVSAGTKDTAPVYRWKYERKR